MSRAFDDLREAYQRNATSDALLDLLLRKGAATEIAQHIRTSEAPQENVSLLERCFQALRKGTLSGAATESQADDGVEGVIQQRLEGATAVLFKAAVSIIASDGDEAQLAAYPSILLDNLDLLKFQQLTALLFDICRAVEAGSSGTPRLLQLLPKAAVQLLEVGAPEDEAEEDDGNGPPIAGAVATRHMDTTLHRLTLAEWVSENGDYAVQIMEALRDVPMTPRQLHAVITRALSVCGKCKDLATLPSLLRQLLRLAGLGQQALVLRGVLALFDRLEAQHRGPDGKGPSQVLQNVEGTALVIIADAFKYDRRLAEELLNSIRASAVAPSPFCLLLLFTLSRQQKLESSVVSLVRTLAIAAFEWDAARTRSAWLSSLPQLPRPTGQQLRTALLRAVRYSGVNGEVVVPGILALGAALMAGCPHADSLALVQLNDVALAAEEASRAQKRQQQQPQHHLPPLPLPPQHQRQPPAGPGMGDWPVGLSGAPGAIQNAMTFGSAELQSALLGIQLLQAAFEAHREARPDVLKLCKHALGGTAGGAGASGGGGAGGALTSIGGLGLGITGQELALPAVVLLSNLVACHTSLLYEHTTKLKNAFESFLLLPAPVALGLLLGLWPLSRCRRDLGDYMVMVLRKVMFAREASSRLVAVRSFLFVLLQQLRAAAGSGAAEDEEQLLAAASAAAAAGPSFSQASCSQSSLSQMQAVASGADVSLQHELQGFLRRALGQQAAVRAALYDGLSEILLVDPGSRDVVLELVAPQFYRYVPDGATMPPLHCKLLVGGGNGTEPVELLEPLPALLACVRRLVALCRDLYLSADGSGAAIADFQGGPPHGFMGLLADEDDMDGDIVMVDDELDDEERGAHVQGIDIAVKSLVRAWDSFARRLLRCEAEHFDLNCSSDLNPTTASGAAKQLQASCLLGAVEVVMEELVIIATGSYGSKTAIRTGERLSRLFELHSRVYDLAREAKSSQGSSKTKQATATEAAAGSGGDGSGDAAGNGTAPQGGGKRARDLCPDLIPPEQRPPAMSPGCLAKLCSGVVRDGLAQLQLHATSTGAAQADGPSAHTRLARSPIFQAFVLRSCLNQLRAAASATCGALSDALVECASRRLARATAREAVAAGQGQSGATAGGSGGDGPGASWRPMARPLMLLCQAVLAAWSGPGKRPPAPRRGGGGGGNAGGPGAAAAAAAARREAAAADSLATLAVSCMRELLAAATRLGGLESVAWVARGLPIHSQDTQAQVDERDLPPADTLLARLPHFSDMLARLMLTNSFKEAASLVEVVVAVARLLPMHAQTAVSDACWELMHQAEPQVTHTGLVRALVGAYATLRGKAELEALLTVATHVQEVVGKAGDETQMEIAAPGVLHEGTAQLAALELFRQLEGHLQQGEELLGAVVRGGSGGAAAIAAAAVFATAGAASGSAATSGSGRSGASGSGVGAAAAAAAGPAAPGAGAGAARSVAQLIDALCRRLGEILQVLQVLVQTRLGNPQVLEAQVEMLIKAYRLLGAVAKAHLPLKGPAAAAAAAIVPSPPPIGRAFHDLVAVVHKDLTPPVYAAVGEDLAAPTAGAGAGGEEGMAAARLSRAKLKRDAKAYARLVHAIEDWEKHLLTLEKAFKAQGLNLMRGAKRSTNRDFQIVAPAAPAGGGAEDRGERRRC